MLDTAPESGRTAPQEATMQMTVLYERLMRLGVSCAEARELCEKARHQLRYELETGNITRFRRFLIPACGGWVYGRLTNHGLMMGNKSR
jgi:hypothetical protein